MHDSQHIFPPWDVERWNDVDDRVRGGSSVSHLEAIDLKSSKGKGVRFWGHLDIDTLGGAGFASQRYRFGPDPLSLPLLDYQGISLSVRPDSSVSSEKRADSFTLVLKTTLSTRPPSKPKTPPSPDPASLSYEITFPGPSDPKTIDLAFKDFQATYRGREVKRDDPKYKPLDTTQIYELSFMCRSAFGEQKGDFGIIIESVNGWKKDKEVGRISGVVRELKAIWSGLVAWMKSFFVSEGRIALTDEEKEPLV